MVSQCITVAQPYKGVWHILNSRDGTQIGVVNGDAVIGYTARNNNGHIVGCVFGCAEEALDALTTRETGGTDLS
ncbi:MAG TPA: hypothetical protein VFF32_15820 [Dermatophilaceae bacterium]|nr:hypothetical protein [Dermatophilaceae bacterium]